MTKNLYLIGIFLCLGGAVLCDLRMYWTGSVAVFLGFCLCLTAPWVADLIKHP